MEGAIQEEANQKGSDAQNHKKTDVGQGDLAFSLFTHNKNTI